MKNILVFCSANKLAEKYTKPATEFARLIAKHGYGFVWGGSYIGLMKIMAKTVKNYHGKIIGVTMELVKHTACKNADKLIVTKNLTQRKATMLKQSDAIVLLVGGVGSLDEVTEILELKKHNVHNKPIVVLNTDNFYEGLQSQFIRMKNDGFLTKPLHQLIYFAKSPKEAIKYLNKKLKN